MNALAVLKSIKRHFAGQAGADPSVFRRLNSVDGGPSYISSYREMTDQMVQADPHEAIGDFWEEIGQLQLDFLVENGLKPHHTLLDIGCGTLRAGRLLIPYLDAGNYTGFDISPAAIAYARELIEQEALSAKRPEILVTDGALRFEEFSGRQFDYLIAQSVLTHLPPENVSECIRHVGAVMSAGSLFFFTYNDAPQNKRVGSVDFRYDFTYLQSLAAKSGLRLEDVSSTYKHRRGQRMALLRRGAAS